MFWRQVKSLTLANMKARYRKTFAGFIWVVMNPILMYTAQSFVFRNFLKLELPNYSLFLLGGLLPWIFITSTIDMCTPVFTNSRELLKAFQMPPLTLICSQVLDNLLNFFFAFLILLVPFWIFSNTKMVGLFLLPLAFLQLIIGVSGMVWFLATAQVFFKDTRFIMQFFTSILFFLTPIFYPISFVPDKYRFAVELNPLYAFIAPIRACIYDFSLNSFFIAWGKSVIFSLFFISLASWFWKSRRNEFYLHL